MDFTKLYGFNDFCYEIFKFLEITDLLQLSNVNKKLYNLIRNYSEYWNQKIIQIQDSYNTVFGKTYFGNSYLTLNEFIKYDQFLFLRNIVTFLIL